MPEILSQLGSVASGALFGAMASYMVTTVQWRRVVRRDREQRRLDGRRPVYARLLRAHRDLRRHGRCFWTEPLRQHRPEPEAPEWIAWLAVSREFEETAEELLLLGVPPNLIDEVKMFWANLSTEVHNGPGLVDYLRDHDFQDPLSYSSRAQELEERLFAAAIKDSREGTR